jgi:hypothetical protein
MIDETAAEFGLFICDCARLEDRLAATLLYLGPNQTSQKYEELLQRPIRMKIQDLKLQVKKKIADLEIRHAGTSACRRMETLIKWRNERVHARVEEDGATQAIALYSWRTRRQLPMNPQLLRKMRVEARNITSDLDRILRSVRAGEAIRTLLQKAFSQVDMGKV